MLVATIKPVSSPILLRWATAEERRQYDEMRLKTAKMKAMLLERCRRRAAREGSQPAQQQKQG